MFVIILFFLLESACARCISKYLAGHSRESGFFSLHPSVPAEAEM